MAFVIRVFLLLLIGILAVAQDDRLIFPGSTAREVPPPEEIDYDPYLDEETSTDTITATTRIKSNFVSESTTSSINSYDNANETTTYNNGNSMATYNEETLPKCPYGLDYYKDKHNVSFCYVTTEPTTFPPLCPYPNNFEYQFSFRENFVELKDEVINKFNTGYNATASPHFRWINFFPDPGGVLGTLSLAYFQNYENANNHCLALNGTRLVPENCSKIYPGICLYHSYTLPPNDYCKISYNETCISNNLGSVTKCYCKSEIELEEKSRNNFCENLAEITSPYENFLLTMYTIHSKPCWIGLHKNNDLTYHWSSTNSSVNYTYWSPTINFTKNYGALGNKGWLLEDDGALDCAICELTIEPQQRPELSLTINETKNIVELKISNANKLLQDIICFTSNDIKFLRIETKGKHKIIEDPNALLENKTKSINILVDNQNPLAVDLWNLSNVFDYCWCLTLHLPSLTYIYSNKILTNNITLIAKVENLTQNRRTCLPSVTTSGNMELHWPETELGTTAIPEELCLQEDGTPVTRTCGGTHTFSSNWLPVNGTCADVTFAPRTLKLDELLRSKDVTPTTLSSNLLAITRDNNNVTSFQIHLVSKVLEKVATNIIKTDERMVKEIVTTINNVMHFEPATLKGAQSLLNSTDAILFSLDELLIKTDTGEDSYTSEISEKMLIQVSDIKKTGIIGIKLEPTELSGFDSSKVQSLQQGLTQDELIKQNLEIAMFTPQELYDDILNCPGSKTSPNMITTVFYDDVLFNEKDNKTGKTDGRIMSVVIPGFNCSFTAPIQVVFKSSHNNSYEIKCASWVYGSNNLMENIHGHWSAEQEPKSVDNSGYHICEFKHVTHFSLLVLGDNRNISEGHKKALDIITAVGSGLSILGLVVVFLTAIIFKSYRSANGVVINFSIAMTAQIVLLFIADNIGEDEVACTIFGAALHYIVLSQFCWMLTIAILQYKRYVLIFSNPTTHLIAKTCAFAWGCPLIPVIIIVSLSRDNYGPNTYGLCYALGNYFIFGVLVPIALIALFNLIVFLRIMISVASSRRIKVHQRNDDTTILQLRLAFMLYFLLGLTWGFGLLAAIGGGVVYSYLFCLTATLQGFVLFLFFVVLNEKTRSLWINMTTCCGKSKSDKYDTSVDSSATGMMRRPKNTASSDTCTDSTTSEMLRRYKNRSSSDF